VIISSTQLGRGQDKINIAPSRDVECLANSGHVVGGFDLRWLLAGDITVKEDFMVAPSVGLGKQKIISSMDALFLCRFGST
jgi:hypothetical protein